MTELTDLSDTDALNTEVTSQSTEGNTANMGGMDNLFQATLGMLSRFRNANIFRLRDNTDKTKLLAFDLSGLTTATTRTVTMGDANVTLRPQAWELVETRTLSGAASAAFTGLGFYRALRISFAITVSTDGTGLLMQTSTNGGSSYDSGASDYLWSRIQGVAGVVSGSNDNVTTGLLMYAGAIGNATGEGVCGRLDCYDFNQSLYGKFEVSGSNQDSAGSTRMFTYSQLRPQAAARNALKISPLAGTISGVVTIEGLRG